MQMEISINMYNTVKINGQTHISENQKMKQMKVHESEGINEHMITLTSYIKFFPK